MVVREKSAGCVVFYPKTQEYLILHFKFKSHYWDFPKGKIKKGETAEQTAIREVKEETGLDVMIIPGFKKTIHYMFKQEGKLISKDVHYFLAEAKSKDAIVSKENIAFEWLSYEKATEKVTFKNSKTVMEKSKAFLKKMEKRSLTRLT